MNHLLGIQMSLGEKTNFDFRKYCLVIYKLQGICKCRSMHRAAFISVMILAVESGRAGIPAPL